MEKIILSEEIRSKILEMKGKGKSIEEILKKLKTEICIHLMATGQETSFLD